MIDVRKTLARGFLIAMPLFACGAALAEDTADNGFDPSLVEQWKESDLVLPAYPQDSDLVAAPLAPSDTLKLYVDAKSVSLARDLVLRLMLVIESPSGARNVFYDGIRCETREYKTYAVGTSDKTLVPVKKPVWQEIPRSSYNAFRAHLYKFYSCDNSSSSALAPQDFLQRLKTGPAQ